MAGARYAVGPSTAGAGIGPTASGPAATTVVGGLHGSTVIGSVATFVQGKDVGVVPVVHAITAGQPVAPGVVFVGRHEETTRLLAALAPDGGDAGPVVVSAVAGMGGVGKTALARYCAAEALKRNWFPGGAYVVDLQGYSPAGMVVRDALFAPLLHQLGVPAEHVPTEPATQAAAYDQRLRLMAEQGRRMLLVLDNASAAAQVDGLLPTAGGHRVVVTTRDVLAIPGARRLDLDVLSVADALELVDEAVREHDPADARAAGTGAGALVGVCGFLPLAVRVAAGLLADEPEMSCAELAAELASAPTDGFTYGETRVAPVLAASINRLAGRDPRAARLLRVLPLHPGPDVSTEAAAALGGVPVAVARTLLRTLRQAHLVISAERRWRLHDLVRRYLNEMGVESGARMANARLLDHYVTAAEAGDGHLCALPGQPVSELFPDRAHALAWFATEHANLVATVRWAAADHPAHTARLAFALREYLSWHRHFTDWLTVSRIALEAARSSGNRADEGRAWNNVGLALRKLRRFDEAVTAHEHARDIQEEVGHRHRVGMAWNNLGLALRELRRFDEAISAHRHACDIHRETGNRHLEGGSWNNLGLALRESGRLAEAIAAHQHARDIHQETGSRNREGRAWNNLGVALRESGQHDEAVTVHQRARDIYQETGDRHGEAMAWRNLGLALRELGQLDRARRCFGEAVAAYTESGNAESARSVRELLDAEQVTGS